MKYARLALSESLKWMISYSLIIAPFYGLNGAAQQAAASPDQDSQSLHSQISILASDLEGLVDRAYFPDVPRTPPTGLPSTNEVSQAHVRIMAVRNAYQTQLNQIATKVHTEQEEIDLLADLNNYFSAVQNYEGLKIAMGSDVRPEHWDVDYRLSISLDSLSQLEFLANAAILSDTLVELPNSGLPFDKIQNMSLDSASLQTHLENAGGQYTLRFSVNPAFAENFERMNYVNNPSQRNVFLYALQWISLRLYESSAQAHSLRGLSLDKLPEPSSILRSQFVSLRVKRDQVLKEDLRRLYGLQKPQVLKAILDAMDAAYKAGNGWILDENFLRTFFTATGLKIDPSALPQQVQDVRKDELKAFNTALVSLLNLSDLKDWQTQVPYLVYEAKRLALRWLYILNPNTHLDSNPDAAAKISQLIDLRAHDIANSLFNQGTLEQTIRDAINNNDLSHLRAQQRLALQTNLQKASELIQNFSTQTINIGYLAATEDSYINSLKPGPYVSSLVDLLKTQKSYRLAYEKYREELYAYMQGFTFPKDADLATLNGVFAASGKATWNPAGLQDKTTPQYLNALNADPKARIKDLSDMVKVGKALKFDKYQASGGSAKRLRPNPTVGGLLTENLFSSLLGSEKAAYQEQVKEDVLNNAPLLGGQVSAMDGLGNNLGFGMLWTYMVDSKTSEATKTQLIDQQLAASEALVGDNTQLVENQMTKLNNSGANALAGAGETLRTLIARASVINAGLSSFAGFGSYYQEMRDQLLLPGLVGRQWEQFSTWANTATNYMIAFWALQWVGSKVAVAGKAADVLGQFFAPIFGAQWSGLNTLMFTFIGITLSDDAIKGYGTEAYRKTILQRFFECGTGQPCVALYRDVVLQDSVAEYHRSRFRWNLATIGGIIIGIRLMPTVVARFSKFFENRRINKVTSYLGDIGMNENSNLSKENVINATREQIVKARSISDPVESRLRQALAQESRYLFESEVSGETAKWVGYNERFATATEQLHLKTPGGDLIGDWKKLSELAEAWGKLEGRYAIGKVSTNDYQQLMQSIYDMKQVLDPVYGQMKGNRLFMKFVERAWADSNKASTESISVEQELYNSMNLGAFRQRMEEFAGGDLSRPEIVNGQVVSRKLPQPELSRLDKLVARLGNVMQKSPEDRSKIEKALEDFKKGGTP